jgi:hypothetical protein
LKHYSPDELDYVLGMRYAICPEPGCDFSIPINYRVANMIYSLTDDHHTEGEDIESLHEVVKQKPLDPNQVKDVLPDDDRYCAKHGVELLFYCPHCKLTLFRTPDPVYCTRCAKKIK